MGASFEPWQGRDLQQLHADRARAGARTGVVTRNCEAAMRAVLVRIEHDFDVALSRSFEPCKPHPAPLLHILERVGASPKEAAMVGDSLDDMDCGNGEVACRAAERARGRASAKAKPQCSPPGSTLLWLSRAPRSRWHVHDCNWQQGGPHFRARPTDVMGLRGVAARDPPAAWPRPFAHAVSRERVPARPSEAGQAAAER